MGPQICSNDDLLSFIEGVSLFTILAGRENNWDTPIVVYP